MSTLLPTSPHPIHRHQPGFTLVEIAVTLFIIGILVTIASVSYTAIHVEARNTEVKEELAKFGSTLVRYKADNGAYPSNTNLLTDAYAVTFKTDELYTETAFYNLLYCSASPYGSYALLAITKNNQRIYIKDTAKPTVYEGGTSWSGSNSTAMCTSVLPGSTPAGMAGYRQSGESPTGWRAWTRGA